MDFIDVKRPIALARDRLDAAIKNVLDHGKFILGPEVLELEQTLAAWTGSKHCLTVASGTDSLEIALRALDIGPGDEVITTPFTWISTAEVIHLVGAKARFVDIDPATFNMDVSLLDAAINERTRAILPVSLFGQMPLIEEIKTIAAKHSLPVIEDGAQSFGATRNGVKSCAATLIGSTSFFPTKPLACCGDGGALFTNDDALAEKMLAIRNHGGLVRDEHTILGMNGRFDTLQAAIMLAKWPDFPAEIEARSRLGARYSALLQNVCATPVITEGNTHVYAQYTIRVPHRTKLGANLKAEGIPTGVYYPKGIHEQIAFSCLGYQHGDFPETERASNEVISLPMHPHLSEAEQDAVVAAILKHL